MKFTNSALLFVFLFLGLDAFAQETVVIDDLETKYPIGNKVGLIEDKEGIWAFDEVKNKQFELSKNAVPNMQITSSVFWAKIELSNTTEQDLFYIDIEHPTIDELILYTPDLSNNLAHTDTLGEERIFSERLVDHQNYVFIVEIPKDSVRTFYLRVRASEQMQLPIYVGYSKPIFESFMKADFIFGIYIGIILVMAIYNLFIFFTVRDITYLVYVSYIVFVGLSQAMLQGYSFRFLWPDNIWLANASAVLVPYLNGITALAFIRRFLHVSEFSPRYNRVILYLMIIYSICIVFLFAGNYILAQLSVQGAAFISAIFVFMIALKGVRAKQRSAEFFLFAWSIFLLSVCIFVLRNVNVLPYNNFTFYALQVGSALEVTLLSFALADKINIYRKEKEASQADALRVSQENERIIREQNVMLEAKVNERTYALNQSNIELAKTLEDLKNAQTKLVDAEKMASLGQLTAGIAHEINNPINFVSSNINPLKRDVDDLIDIIHKYDDVVASQKMEEEFLPVEKLKKEVDFEYLKHEIEILLKGMEDGAGRTVEIVKGLKSFSRLDESDLKFANINDGIDSTLIILNSTFKGKIDVIKELGDIPEIECFAGKLNQVFMNIINNAAQALLSGDKADGKIIIHTEESEGNIIIRIKDNGPGMPEAIQKRIFEPFFTTKKAGDGTGLGLSIVFSIIELHQGEIKVESEEGIGTEFIISLPIVQS